jgi:hypothetical protein
MWGDGLQPVGEPGRAVEYRYTGGGSAGVAPKGGEPAIAGSLVPDRGDAACRRTDPGIYAGLDGRLLYEP